MTPDTRSMILNPASLLKRKCRNSVIYSWIKTIRKYIPRHSLCTTLQFQRNLLCFMLKYVGSSLDKIIHIVIEFYENFYLFIFCVTSKTDTQLERLTALITKRPPQTQFTCAWKVKQPQFRYLCCSGGRWATFILWTVQRIIMNHPLLCETHLGHFTFHCTVCIFITSSYSFKIHYSVMVFTCSGSHCSTSH